MTQNAKLEVEKKNGASRSLAQRSLVQGAPNQSGLSTRDVFIDTFRCAGLKQNSHQTHIRQGLSNSQQRLFVVHCTNYRSPDSSAGFYILSSQTHSVSCTNSALDHPWETGRVSLAPLRRTATATLVAMENYQKIEKIGEGLSASITCRKFAESLQVRTG